MLIYAYADILGYRDMLKKHKSCEIYNILNNAINDMHMLLNKYLNSDLVLEEYKFGLYLQTDLYDKILYNLSKTEEDYVKLKSASIKNPDCNKIRNEYRNYQTLYNQIDASSLTFKSYIAFDTIVIYWDKFEYSEINMKVFLLAIDLLYMLLYDKDILIRGAIGCTDDFHIDEEGNERFFLINNIDVASEIEHSQNSANLIVFGNELHNCCQSITGNGITDDYYTRTPCPITEREKQFAKDHPDQQIIYFKDGYYTQIITGKDKKSTKAK